MESYFMNQAISSKAFLAVAILGIICIAGVLLAMNVFLPQSSVQLSGLLRSEGCIASCFVQIEPSVSTSTTVEDVLSQRGIVFEKRDAIALGVGPYYSFKDPLVAFLGDHVSVTIGVHENYVREITIGPTDYCVSQVLSELGKPANWHDNGISFELYYPSFNLIIYVRQDKPQHVASFRLLDRTQYQFFSEDTNIEKWDESFASRFNGCTP